MAGMVRVVLMPRGETPEDRQIIVDMLADVDGVAIGPFPAFGRIGDYRKPETLLPFTLMMDGRVDLGARAPADASQGVLAIRKATLAMGAEIGGPQDETFVITTLTPLAAG